MQDQLERYRIWGKLRFYAVSLETPMSKKKLEGKV